MKDLPVVQEETIEGFKAEAQEEVKYALEEEAAEEMEEK